MVRRGQSPTDLVMTLAVGKKVLLNASDENIYILATIVSFAMRREMTMEW